MGDSDRSLGDERLTSKGFHSIRLMKKSDRPFIEKGLIETNWQDIPDDQKVMLKRKKCDKAMLNDFELFMKNKRIKYTIFVAVDSDDEPIGFISIGLSQNPTVKLRFGNIFDFYVTPEWRNKGVGQNLIAYAIHKIRKRKLKYAGLYVSANNEVALHLYDKFGFYSDRILKMKKL
ncbi:MAG: GNAT family N-acetyltransferase [Candidatus Thermoplasmatota archaeon]